jgi:hypothetical protein
MNNNNLPDDVSANHPNFLGGEYDCNCTFERIVGKPCHENCSANDINQGDEDHSECDEHEPTCPQHPDYEPCGDDN